MEIIQNIIGRIKNISMESIIEWLITAIIIMLFFMISNLISYIIVKIINFKEKNKNKIKNNVLYKPTSSFIKITGIYIGIMFLKVPIQSKLYIVKFYKIGIMICVANVLINIFNPKSKVFNKLEKTTKYKGDKQLNNFVSKLIKVIIYIITGYLIMQELGYNLGGLVTGLGISSVIIAFAAQDIAKNLFGGFAIITDKPFSVGDWIEVGEYSGTVVDITFRSTKIKAVDSTIITINNATIVDTYVKNWGNIDRRRYNVTLNLPLQTSEETIRRVLKKIKFVLKSNEDIIEDTLQVHFEKIDSDGIKIIIFLNTSRTDYNEYLDFKEVINLELIKVLESENVKLAYPGRNIYINPIDEIKENKNINKQKNKEINSKKI